MKPVSGLTLSLRLALVVVEVVVAARLLLLRRGRSLLLVLLSLKVAHLMIRVLKDCNFQSLIL